MNCERSEELLHDLLDRRLSQTEEAELRVHLAACSRCAVQLRELEELLAQTRSLEEPPLPAGFADSVMAAVRKEQILPSPQVAGPSGAARRNRFRLVSLGAIGSIAAGFLLFVVFHSQREGPQAPRGEMVEAQLAKQTKDPQQKLNLARDEMERTANEPVPETAPEAPAPLGLSAEKAELARSDRRPGEVISLHFLARAENPQAESLLRASAEGFSKKLLLDAPAEKTKQEERRTTNEGFAMGIAPSEPVVRLLVSRSELAKLQESWKKIPGLHILESDAGKGAGKSSLGRSAPAAEPAPAPARAKEQEAPSAGATAPQSSESYKGPGDSAPPKGEEIVEVVITLLPPEPAAKPK